MESSLILWLIIILLLLLLLFYFARSVQLLLSKSACPNLVDDSGVAAIHLAAGKETEKNTRCLKILLQFGADPNVK